MKVQDNWNEQCFSNFYVHMSPKGSRYTTVAFSLTDPLVLYGMQVDECVCVC